MRLLHHLKKISSEAEDMFLSNQQIIAKKTPICSVKFDNKKNGGLFKTAPPQKNPLKNSNEIPKQAPKRKLKNTGKTVIASNSELKLNINLTRSSVQKNSTNIEDNKKINSTRNLKAEEGLEKITSLKKNNFTTSILLDEKSMSDNDEPHFRRKINLKVEEEESSIANSDYYVEKDVYGNFMSRKHKPFRMKNIVKWPNILNSISKDYTYVLLSETVNRWSIGHFKEFCDQLEKYFNNRLQRKQTIAQKKQASLSSFLSKIQKKEQEIIKKTEKHPAIIAVRSIISKYDHRKFELKLPKGFITHIIMTCQEFFNKTDNNTLGLDNPKKKGRRGKTQSRNNLSDSNQRSGDLDDESRATVTKLSISCGGTSIGSIKDLEDAKKEEKSNTNKNIDDILDCEEFENNVHKFISEDALKLTFDQMNAMIDGIKQDNHIQKMPSCKSLKTKLKGGSSRRVMNPGRDTITRSSGKKNNLNRSAAPAKVVKNNQK